MKYILILLALVFSISCNKSKKTDDTVAVAKTPSTSAEADYKSGKAFYSAGNYEDGFTWLTNAANQGHAEAQYDLGVAYFIDTEDQDYAKALAWFKKAIELGNAKPKYYLGWMYEFGYGVDQSDEQATIWYKDAVADGGHPAAQRRLEVLYESGRATKDTTE